MKIIKIPWSLGSMKKNDGCELAPEKIVEEIENLFLNEDGKDNSYDVDKVEIIKDNFEETNNKIIKKIEGIKRDAVLLGGDHSITYAAVKAFSKVNEDAGMIMIDAHPDCTSDFLPATHEDIIRAIVNENLIKPENIILIGIRSLHKDEKTFLEKHKIKVYTMKEISYGGLNEISHAVMSAAKNFGSLYLSVDIDAVDPAFAPATGYIEPGGLTSRELLYFIHRFKNLKNLKMADLVEINPKLDPSKITVKLGAKILKELI